MDWLYRLEQVLQTDLPGEVAHKDMIPYRPLTSQMLADATTYRDSSVAILLYVEEQCLKSVLIERPSYDGAHSGQMAFPGGKVDVTDENLVATALREMHEEIGFYDSDIRLLGQLTKVFIPVSNFLVYPHVFFTTKTPVFKADHREVKEIVPFRIDDILDQQRLIRTTVETGTGMRMKNVPAFEIEKKNVWGATCLIMNEFRICLEKSNF